MSQFEKSNVPLTKNVMIKEKMLHKVLNLFSQKSASGHWIVLRFREIDFSNYT